MEFEWDEDKNKANFTKHGVNFETAGKIFDEYEAERGQGYRFFRHP